MAAAGRAMFVRSKEAAVLNAIPKEGSIGPALDAVLTEAARAGRFGFTATELERQKRETLRTYERLFAEREKHDPPGWQTNSSAISRRRRHCPARPWSTRSTNDSSGDRARRSQQDRGQLDGRPEPGRDGVGTAETRTGRARRDDARGDRQGHRGEADHGYVDTVGDMTLLEEIRSPAPSSGRDARRQPASPNGSVQRREGGAQADRTSSKTKSCSAPSAPAARRSRPTRIMFPPAPPRGDVDHRPREVQRDRLAQGHWPARSRRCGP